MIALEPIHVRPKVVRWRCRCDCGKVKDIDGKQLRNGNTRSCGCLQAESRHQRTTHGLTVGHELPAEYESWCKIKSRCHNPGSDRYKFYGARGITMCQRWRDSFTNFLADMGHRPGPSYTVERRDNDGHYEPGNCCWATKKKQANNRRSNVRIAWKGQELTVAEWSDELSISASLIRGRLKQGWPIERIFTEPVDVSKHHKSRLRGTA